MDQHSPAIDQAILARFIDEFNKLLSDRFILQIPEAGLHFVAWLRRESDFERVARVRAQIGVKPSPLSFFCIQAKLKPAFVFGFAAWTPTQIRESLLRLASALSCQRLRKHVPFLERKLVSRKI